MAVSTTTVTAKQADCKAEIAGDATVNNEQTYPKKAHIRDQPITLGNWYKHVNWFQSILLTITPMIAIYGLYSTPITYKTAIWTVIYYYFTGLGITAGYHRYWAHRAYSASRLFQLFLLMAASGAVEGSARWWCRDHRAHHRYTDTDKDPYSASKGLLYSHVGWMYLKQNPARIGRADISDLNADPLLRNQHKHYALWAITFGFLVPTVIAGFGWGDWRVIFFPIFRSFRYQLS
jgi:stearoyl-CoA desaturase (delta-9 desaturase)